MQHTNQHFLQKLYSREIHGTFYRGNKVDHNKAAKLFNSIPDRLMFYLKDVLQHMGNHILVGTTRCGQFLITYSYATELRLPVQMHYKYRLHWWAFRPGAPAYKVAEVQLFDNQEVTYSLTVGIAQWPNINDKLIAYGYSDESDDAPFEQEEGDVESRRYYITVTTLPSLHDCKDCKAVAESFDEEDMAANWDSCIGLTCLKHGLTIHTTLNIAPPYPPFDFLTNLKIDNKIIVNTGNFLHVLCFGSDKEEMTASEDDNIVPDEISHKIGEKLMDVKDYICPWKAITPSNLSSRRNLARSVNKAWLNTIMDRAEKVYAFEESDDGCEPRFKWFRRRRLADKMYEFCEEELENVCPPAKIPRHLSPSKYFSSRESTFECRLANRESVKDGRNVDVEEECWKNSNKMKTELERNESILLAHEPKYFVEAIRNKHMEIECKRRREQFDSNIGNVMSCGVGNSLENIILAHEPKYFIESLRTKKMDVESRRKKDQVIVPINTSCDYDVSNECDSSKRLDGTSSQHSEESHKVLVRSPNYVGDISCKSDCDNLCNLLVKDLHNTPESSTGSSDPLPSKSDYHKNKPLDISIINPDLSAILAEWEADSVSSLSPNSECFLYKNNENKNDVVQSFLELIPGMTISPRSSTSGMRYPECFSPEPDENHSPRLNDSPHSVGRITSPNSPLATSKYSPLLVVLRTRNSNSDKESQRTKDQEEKCKSFSKEEVTARVKTGRDVLDNNIAMRQRMISGCSVRFDRIYIEVDEEIISTITDIEDDDQGTGFHCALPLSVHGSAYAQLQMVSSQKAEKMNMHCERVYQTSLDIEQFCFKAADTICKCEGYKFWFCNDYDVEIIDVCPFNGDILGVVCMRLNAEKKQAKNERLSIANQRFFYEVRCVFIWNPGTDRCWLEAYSHFVDVTKCVNSHWAPARKEASGLRKALKTSTLFALQPFPPIRTFAHRMWTEDNVLLPSLEEIRDHDNLIGFRLVHVPERLRQVVEFL